jgi:hypothetical protein
MCRLSPFAKIVSRTARRLRWSYASDSIYQGRGVYVDGVHIEDASGVLLNGERPSDAARFQASGWIESSN